MSTIRTANGKMSIYAHDFSGTLVYIIRVEETGAVAKTSQPYPSILLVNRLTELNRGPVKQVVQHP